MMQPRRPCSQRRGLAQQKKREKTPEERLEEFQRIQVQESETALFKSKTVWVMANPELYMNVNNPYAWKIVAGVWVMMGGMGAYYYWLDQQEINKNLAANEGSIGPRRPDGNV